MAELTTIELFFNKNTRALKTLIANSNEGLYIFIQHIILINFNILIKYLL